MSTDTISPDTTNSKSPDVIRRQGIENARNSPTGKQMTRSQFNEGMAITSIAKQAIQKSGSFTEKLTDYSHAFARSEQFDAMRGETMIRDLFKARYGQTMNQMREELLTREDNLLPEAKDKALHHAKSIEPMIRDGDTMPFYKAYDKAGGRLAKELQITETGAKELMKEAYREATGQDLYERSKDLEAEYHLPAKEAAREAKQAERAPQKHNQGARNQYQRGNGFRTRRRA